MPNDSLIPPDGGVGIVPLHASIINYDEVMQMAANEPSLGILGNIPYTRVWTSLDLSELADWPAELLALTKMLYLLPLCHAGDWRVWVE